MTLACVSYQLAAFFWMTVNIFECMTACLSQMASQVKKCARVKKQEFIYMWLISSNEVKQKPTFVFINSQFIEHLKDWLEPTEHAI